MLYLLCSLRCLLALVNGCSREADPKFLHPKLEGRTLPPQTSRRSVRSCNDSIRVSQSMQNLIRLRLFQHLPKALM